MTSLASLVLQVNATSVGAATTSLNQLAAAGVNAQTATNNLTRATQQANTSILANQQAWFSNAAAINSSTNALSHLANGFKSAFFGASIAVGLIELKNNLINLTDTLIHTQVQVDKLRNSLNFAVGRGAAAGDLAFIKQSAQDMGLSFVTVTEQYVRLAAASRQTSLEGQKTKDIFTAVSQASTVLGLSADETTGALRAITQMISKNTVMSEELKGQLGERLPGAFQIAARAMGVTTQELNKMLETGKVLAEDFLPKFAAQLMRETAPDIEAASQSMQASLNRLETAWTLFKQAVVKSGVGQSLSEETSGLANYFAVLSESMDRSRESGAGLSSQLMTGLGTALARMPFDVVNSSANLLNGTINLLSGGFIHLSTNVNVLPQMFETSAYASEMLGERLTSAEQDLASLQAKLAIVPDNIYLKDSTYQAYLLVQQLKAAKQAQDSLSGNAGRGNINPETVAQLEASAERRQQRVDDLMRRSSGISDAYVRRAKEIQELNADGALSADQLRIALDGLHKLLPKVTSAKKSLSDAQKLVNAGERAYGDIMAKETGYAANFTETVLSLAAARDKNNWSSEKYNEVIAAYVAQQPFYKEMVSEEKKEAEAAAKRWGEGYVRQIEAEEKAYRKLADAIEDVDKTINSLLRENDKLQVGNDLNLSLMGQTAEARAAAIEQQQVLNKYLDAENEARLKYLDPTVLQSKLELIEVQKLRALELSAQSKAITAWNKTFDTIESGLVSALMTGGKEGGKAARDLIAKMLILEPFEIIVKAYLQPVTTALTNLALDATGLASSVSGTGGIMGMANTGASLLSGTSSFSLGLQGTISTITEQGIIGGISNAFTSTTSLAAAGDFMGAIGAAIPYIGGALAIVGLLGSIGNDRPPSQSTGGGSLTFDQSGTVTDTWSRYDGTDSNGNLGLTTAVEDIITSLYADYANAASTLGIQTVPTEFVFGSNTGAEGKDPQFAIANNTAGVGFDTGEIQQTDEAVQLAASRAVFNALQQSELPKYLAGAFDGLTASTATQEQITAALDGASALQSFHDQLQLLPWDSLKDMTYATTQALVDMSGGLDALQTNLGTFYDNFYTDAEKTALLTANTTDAFAALGITMPAVDEGMRDWYRTLVESVLALDQSDAANAGATVAVLSLQTAVDSLAPAFTDTTQTAEDAAKALEDAAAAMQDWQDKLDVATGKTTERALSLSKDLADAADDQTRALIKQVYAAEDAATAAQTAADAMQSLTDAIQSMAEDTANIIAGMADIGKTDFQKSIAQIKRDGDANQSSLDALVAPATAAAATAAATAAVAATSVTTYSGASYAYTVPAAQNDGSMGGFTAEQNASIQSYVAGLDWSAEGTAASSAALLNAMTEVGVSLEHMSNLGYSTTDLKNVASFATAQINNDYAAANPTMAYMGSNYSNWGGPAADAWSSSSYGYGSGGSATGGTSSGGAASSSIAASAAENTAAKINAAYAEQLQSMIDAYKPDTQAVDAVAALTAAGFLIDGLDASGIKKYFYDIASAADPLTETGKATIDALDALSGQIGLLGQVAADRQTWQNKLDVLTGATTDQALQRQADLASTTDVATLAIIKQVHAQEDIAAAQVEIARQQAEALEALAKAADLLNDKLALQATLYELTGNKALSAATLAAQRAIELDSLDASLRDLTSQIWAAQDAISSMDTAMGAVERAVNAQRTSISDGASAQIDAIRASADANKASIDVAQKSVYSLKGIFDDITSAVKTLRGNVDPVTSMLQARSYIDMSLSLAEAGVMPNADKLKDALGVVTKDSADTYASGAEFRFAQLAQAGKLDKLNAIVGTQKTTAEQQLESLNNLNTAAADQIKAIEDARDAQLKMLDAQLKEAQDAVDVMKGIDISVMSVSEAIKGLNAAINGVSGATGNPAVPVSDRTITPGGGGGSSGSGSSYESPYGGSLANNYNATTSFNGHSMQGLGIDINVLTGSTGNAKNLGNVDMLYSAAQNLGWTSADISNAYSQIGYNITQAEILQRASEQGIPAFAVGTNYVPHDMVAKIHEGEAIVPKAWNPAAGGRGGQNSDRLERLVEGLTKEVQRLQTIVNDGNKQTKRVADNIDNVTEGGNAMRTRTA